MGAVSLEEAQAKCPGLVIKSMRTERYRQVAAAIHAALRPFAPDGQVRRALAVVPFAHVSCVVVDVVMHAVVHIVVHDVNTC